MCRVAADWLSLPLESITVVSISSQPDSEEAAARLGLRCLRLPPAEAAGHWLQAATLQAVATAAAAAQQALLVGYVMKHSRQLALEKAGMLPLLPTEGLCFAPLVLSRPLADQAPCRLLLHKLTDSLQPSSSGAGGSSAGSSGEVAQLSPEAQRFLQQAAQAEAATGVRLVDPMPAVQRVIDRAALAELLDRLTLAVRQAFIPMRSPAWTLVEGFDPVTTPAQLAAAHVRLPCIVKPRAACGVAEAHQMAFVLAEEGFAGLEVPLPAVVQEYVDHGGRVWKVYVAGSQVRQAAQPGRCMGRAAGWPRVEGLRGWAARTTTCCVPTPAPSCWPHSANGCASHVLLPGTKPTGLPPSLDSGLLHRAQVHPRPGPACSTARGRPPGRHPRRHRL